MRLRYTEKPSVSSGEIFLPTITSVSFTIRRGTMTPRLPSLKALLESLGEPFVSELFLAVERIEPSQVVGCLWIVGFGLGFFLRALDLRLALVCRRFVFPGGLEILQRH